MLETTTTENLSVIVGFLELQTGVSRAAYQTQQHTTQLPKDLVSSSQVLRSSQVCPGVSTSCPDPSRKEDFSFRNNSMFFKIRVFGKLYL